MDIILPCYSTHIATCHYGLFCLKCTHYSHVSSALSWQVQSTLPILRSLDISRKWQHRHMKTIASNIK